MTQHKPTPTPGEVRLRAISEADLAIFFEQQLDPEANHMAAFTSRDPTDRKAFLAHWTKILGNAAGIARTILYEGQIAGYIVSYEHFGKPSIGYWIGREFWGQGIATQALEQFLWLVTARPLYARVVKDNLASLRVLHKCGFTIVGEDEGFANARGKVVGEYILELKG